jgi:hypothetical protein
MVLDLCPTPGGVTTAVVKVITTVVADTATLHGMKAGMTVTVATVVAVAVTIMVQAVGVITVIAEATAVAAMVGVETGEASFRRRFSCFEGLVV